MDHQKKIIQLSVPSTLSFVMKSKSRKRNKLLFERNIKMFNTIEIIIAID